MFGKAGLINSFEVIFLFSQNIMQTFLGFNTYSKSGCLNKMGFYFNDVCATWYRNKWTIANLYTIKEKFIIILSPPKPNGNIHKRTDFLISYSLPDYPLCQP
jgi:hypothetical protein